MEDAVLAPIQSAKPKDYEGGTGFNAAVKPAERTTEEPADSSGKPGNASHGMEDPALTPVQSEPKKQCKLTQLNKGCQEQALVFWPLAYSLREWCCCAKL